MRVASYRRGGQREITDFHFVYFDNTKGDAVNCFRSFAMFGTLRKTNFVGNEFKFLDTAKQSKFMLYKLTILEILETIIKDSKNKVMNS